MADSGVKYTSIPQSDTAVNWEQPPNFQQPDQQQPPPPPYGQQPPPQFSNSPGPQQPGYPLHHMQPPPAPVYPQQQYAPAPQSFVQQQSSSNVVVVNSQPQAQSVVHVVPARAPTYITLTAVLMIICFIHGNLPAFLCLIPAMICAFMASEHNSANQIDSARSCGQMAFCCNICVFVYYAMAVLAAITLVILYFTIGLAFLGISKNDNPDNSFDNTFDYYNNY